MKKYKEKLNLTEYIKVYFYFVFSRPPIAIITITYFIYMTQAPRFNVPLYISIAFVLLWFYVSNKVFINMGWEEYIKSKTIINKIPISEIQINKPKGQWDK